MFFGCIHIKQKKKKNNEKKNHQIYNVDRYIAWDVMHDVAGGKKADKIIIFHLIQHQKKAFKKIKVLLSSSSSLRFIAFF